MMSEKISLKEAEQKAFRAIFLDGLNEMLWGLIILSLVLSAILRDPVGVPLNYLPVFLVLVIGIPAQLAAKKWLVTPRMGLVMFAPRRRRKISRVRWVMIILFVITLIVFLLPFLNKGETVTVNGPYWIVDAVFGFAVIALFSFIAFSYEQPRMHLYGLLLGLSLPFDVVFEETTGLDWPLGMFVAGSVMLVVGIVIFSRFLRDYPIPEGGVYDGSNG
jgi:MFS family permease